MTNSVATAAIVDELPKRLSQAEIRKADEWPQHHEFKRKAEQAAIDIVIDEFNSYPQEIKPG